MCRALVIATALLGLSACASEPIGSVQRAAVNVCTGNVAASRQTTPHFDEVSTDIPGNQIVGSMELGSSPHSFYVETVAPWAGPGPQPPGASYDMTETGAITPTSARGGSSQTIFAPDGGAWTIADEYSPRADYTDTNGHVHHIDLPFAKPGYVSVWSPGCNQSIWISVNVQVNPDYSSLNDYQLLYHITPEGKVDTQQMPSVPGLGNQDFSGMAMASGGRLCYVRHLNNQSVHTVFKGLVGCVNPDGSVTEHPLPDDDELDISSRFTTGPDGNVWALGESSVTQTNEVIYRIDSQANLTAYPTPITANSEGCTPSPTLALVPQDGYLWFMAGCTGSLYRLTV